MGDKFLSEVSHDDIDALHREVSRCTPVQANRCVVILRHFFNISMRWGKVQSNPAVGSIKNPEIARERYLTEKELNSFLCALAARPSTPSRLAIEFLLLTGARRGEVLSATWDQFDLEGGIWTKPSAHTKQRRTHRVPLSTLAIETLRNARQQSAGNVVFAGRSGKPLVEIKKAFRSVCTDAGIVNFRLHDLRHSFASMLASHGVGLPIIGKLLGHSLAKNHILLEQGHFYRRYPRELVQAIKSREHEGNGGQIAARSSFAFQLRSTLARKLNERPLSCFARMQFDDRDGRNADIELLSVMGRKRE